MSNVRYPGFLWVIGIVVSVILLLRFFDAEIVALVFIPLILGILKAWKIGTEEENIAIDAIEAIKNNPRVIDAIKGIQIPRILGSKTQYRGPSEYGDIQSEEVEVVETPLVLPATPPRPNKMLRWLVG